ncbi:alpha/beta hydrolase [Mucilaginibacter sp. FT3.2]|uniref:alpha/beta hydrolase n=1 Tax=Mucilaginibacter sp. FT3.2 TaxID=2723090 RepID=UPI0016215657|nr:alpha/beta hydrolase [Mucilaginibacter sp. FT3.2]MBB6233506.1 pimeloyl-ACP methyl ester carboxylesterase [Mucilaginibacter sp. FT3.2]
MSKIYLIAGLGADTRVYNNINFRDHEVIPVDWIEPNPLDTLAVYAQKLVCQYNIQVDSIVIGNSLGGMLAVEIAKFIPVKKVIIISSIKTSDEAPWYFKLFRNLPVQKLIPGKLVTSMGFVIKPMFGKMSEGDAWLFQDMLKKTSPVFVKWAMSAILIWKNEVIPPNLYHITGDKDLIFDYKRIKDATVIKGGTHIMIFDKAKEINKFLKQILSKK